MAGLGAFGRAWSMEHATVWRRRAGRTAQRLPVTLVDPHATEAAQQIVARWPMVAEQCELTPVDGDVGEALARVPELAQGRMYLCYENEELALNTALTVVGLWAGGQASLVVRLSRLSGHVRAFDHDHAGGPGGRLRLVGVTELGCDPVEIARDQVERFAEAIHDNYLLKRLGYESSPGVERVPVPWQDLSEAGREASRAQALDISAKLVLVGITLAPRSSHDPAVRVHRRGTGPASDLRARPLVGRAARQRLGLRGGPQRRREDPSQPGAVGRACPRRSGTRTGRRWRTCRPSSPTPACSWSAWASPPRRWLCRPGRCPAPWATAPARRVGSVNAGPVVGVLALQGDVREHLHALAEADAVARPVRRPEELDGRRRAWSSRAASRPR